MTYLDARKVLMLDTSLLSIRSTISGTCTADFLEATELFNRRRLCTIAHCKMRVTILDEEEVLILNAPFMSSRHRIR